MKQVETREGDKIIGNKLRVAGGEMGGGMAYTGEVH